MKAPERIAREAYIRALEPLIFNGVEIPVYEEIVNEAVPVAVLRIGGIDVEAYIILLNQSNINTSPKCLQNNRVATHLQITTLFPLGKGGSQIAEDIAEQMYVKLEDFADPLIWMHRVVTGGNIPYHTEKNSVWVHQIVFQDEVNQ